MGRRKTYMDDNSSSDEEGGRIRFDITQDDLDAEVSGFSGFQRQRFRNSHDSSSEEEDRQEGLSGLGLAPSFQTAKQTPVKDPVKEKVRARQTGSPSPGPGFAEFNKHSKGFGQKMLEKMGWNRGQGLGADGSGIVNPVDIKQRPARMGLSFKGFDERTDQAKQEAKLRRGEEPGEDEKPKPSKRDAWKSTAPSEKKTRKPKTIYKTAADILAEAEESIALPQRVIDMTGPGIREINLADIKRTDSPTLMEVTTRLPELRHNLSLIVDLARMDLENLSREKQTTAFRMKSLQTELDTIQHNLEKEQQQLAKIEQLKTIAQRLEQISKDGLATGAFKKGNMTSLFGEQFDILSRDFDVKTFHIDALVVSVWAPVLKYACLDWQVLEDPTRGVSDVKQWRHLLISNSESTSRIQKKMTCTPFETMLNTIWLSKVRSAINNQWDVHHPDPLIQLMEAWEPYLPRFIYENIIHQLILPKLSRAVSDWNPRTDPIMIHTWIHPWFPLLKAWRLADLFTHIRHKMAVVLRQWHPSDESALHIIAPWKDVWTSDQLEQFTTKYILPKLTSTLHHEFTIDPRNQSIEPLVWCLAWKDVLSDTMIGLLLKHEFFVGWHTVLVQWLGLDIYHINYDDISDWYRWWRQVFDAYGLHTNKLVMQEFRKGLDAMNQALAMGLSKKE